MNENIKLYYRNDAEHSDKVYELTLLEIPNEGWTVCALFGRRGKTMQKDLKTKTPLPYDDAKILFEAVIKAKLKGGYRIGVNSGLPAAPAPRPEAPARSATLPYPEPPRKPPVAVPPQELAIQAELLTPVEMNDAGRFVSNKRFWLQEKRDGKRLMICKRAGRIFGTNKLGEQIAIDSRLRNALKAVEVPSFILDGEIEGHKKNNDLPAFQVWDLLELDGTDLRPLPYEMRYEGLVVFGDVEYVHILPSFRSESEKREALLAMAQQRKEGVVFKDSTAVYAGARAAQHFKLKFTKSATCRVSRWNTEISTHTGAAKRSVFVELLDDEGNWIEVGGVSIAPRYTVNVGDLIEVRYLYATADRRLYQPSFLGVRDDVRPQDCTLRQLVFKAGVEMAERAS